MKIIHLSAECYPAAKVGGLADVVGSLPKYQINAGLDVIVMIPKYDLPWFDSVQFTKVYSNEFWNPEEQVIFEILQCDEAPLGFPLYVIDIPNKFDRKGVYEDDNGFFADDPQRWLSFQRAALIWIFDQDELPEILHLHDHHVGFIPFILQYSYGYQAKHEIKTIFTIHNERYHGAFGWDKQYLLPHFDNWKSGLLDWNNHIDPLAAAVKCADAVSTVSPSYMEELKDDSNGLEWLFQSESDKCVGILNGIDKEVWNPATDPRLEHHLKKSPTQFKQKNKEALCSLFSIDPQKPLISFIGRMVHEKGADLLAHAIHQFVETSTQINFVILGTGDPEISKHFEFLTNQSPENCGIKISYDETLAHRIYAGSDFIIMPSRVEPCGLNQMYAMRYGAIPIVNNIGGLKDSVTDYQEEHGTGIKMKTLSIEKIKESFEEALQIYNRNAKFNQTIHNCMNTDFSWEASVQNYLKLYESIIN